MTRSKLARLLRPFAGRRSVAISARRWLYLPIETKSREFEAKAILAFEAAARGWAACIGRKKMWRRPDLPLGTFLEGSLGRAELMRFGRQTGHRISAVGEEGLTYSNAEDYFRDKIDQSAFSLLDWYFAWGEREAGDMARLSGEAGKVVATGNPRADLYRPEWRALFASRADAIRRRYGTFILVNTKFNRANNHRQSSDMIGAMRDRGRINDDDHEAYAWNYVEFQQRNLQHFRDMLPVLRREFPDAGIVVRPHPSENHQMWREIASPLSGVEVVYEGSVAAWLLAAAVSIHNNCTTGVEAYLLDRPTIAYTPYRDERYEAGLTTGLSSEARDIDGLVGAVRTVLGNGSALANPDIGAQRDKLARHYIANASGPSAADSILGRLEETDLPVVALDFTTSRVEKMMQSIRRSMKQRPQSGDNREQAASRIEFRRKFERLTRSELRDLLDLARRVSGRFKDIEVAEVGESTFCIYRP